MAKKLFKYGKYLTKKKLRYLMNQFMMLKVVFKKLRKNGKGELEITRRKLNLFQIILIYF